MMEFPEFYEAKSPPEWATMCPDRNLEFKVHTSLGLAHTAIGYHKPQSEIALYHLEVVDGAAVWKKTWEYSWPTQCAVCGNLPQRQRRYSPQYYIQYDWKGTVKDAPVVCSSCHDNGRQRALDAYKRKQDLAVLHSLKELYPDA